VEGRVVESVPSLTKKYPKNPGPALSNIQSPFIYQKQSDTYYSNLINEMYLFKKI
jgi:hypothetical protein